MEKLFSGFITIFSVPILILNILSGLVGGIWLIISGNWSLFIYGLIYMAISSTIIGLLLMPTLLFAAPAAAFAEKRKYIMFFIFSMLSILYTYGLITLSTYFVANFALSVSSAPLWASLLWLYAISLAPWQYMASKEQDNTATIMTTFFLSVGTIVLMICVGFFGMTLERTFPLLVATLVISLVIQLLFMFSLVGAEKQIKRHDKIIDIDEVDQNQRTWRDLE